VVVDVEKRDPEVMHDARERERRERSLGWW